MHPRTDARTDARIAAVMTAAALMLPGGCTSAGAPGGTPAETSVGTPAETPAGTPAETPSRLGGEMGTPSRSPTVPMNMVEDAIAKRLGAELRGQRLSVDYVDCPRLTRTMPQAMMCEGYIDGVTAEVSVRLTGSVRGGMRFDARLGNGIVSASNLAGRLAAEGYSRIDCGERAAYPSVVGRRIVCAVTRDGDRGFVVATITTRGGGVEISDY